MKESGSSYYEDKLNKLIDSPDKAERNKEIYKLHLQLTDPGKYKELYGNNATESSGKVQEGWTQTPSSPLQ